MKIGIIGSGNIGSTAARLFTEAGHEVTISNSREPQSLAGLVDDLGANAHAATPTEAARFGEVVMEAIPFGRYEELPADALADSVFISASNYYPERDGEIDFGDRTETELVADHLSDARVIKAFNTMNWETLRDDGRPEAGADERLVLFVAGDDPEAKEVVSDLIEDVGFTPIDTGSLREGGRRQQPGSPIYGELMKTDEAQTTLADIRRRG